MVKKQYKPLPTYVDGKLIVELTDSLERGANGLLLKPNKLFCEYYNQELRESVRMEMPWGATAALLPDEVKAAFTAAMKEKGRL